MLRELLGKGGAARSQQDGLLSGTWSLWWTNSLGDESVAFTIRFLGVRDGTVEILNDETETDTSFEWNGDEVSFRFTRLVGDRNVPEESRWEGTWSSSAEWEGTWSREDWECPPPPGDCTIGPGFTDFDSRLVRED